MNEGSARVLAALRRAEGRTCSGVALSEELGVSRAQIWKRVENLRARGYTVDAEAGGGYRLGAVPDRLYPEEVGNGLRTSWLAQEIHYFDETDSTNRVALDLARQGAPHGATVIAEGQTAGRGRLGRAFFSALPEPLHLDSAAAEHRHPRSAHLDPGLGRRGGGDGCGVPPERRSRRSRDQVAQ